MTFESVFLVSLCGCLTFMPVHYIGAAYTGPSVGACEREAKEAVDRMKMVGLLYWIG